MFFAIGKQQTSSAQISGRYTTREVNGATKAEWDGWLESSPGGGHILQSYEWGEFKRRYGWKPVRLVLERDGEVVGVGQFLSQSTPFVPGKMMYCTKGPWLPWDDEQAVRIFFKAVRAVAEREGAHTIKIEPEALEQQTRVKEHLSEIGFRKFRWDLQGKTTMTVDLSQTEEELLARMKGKTRYNIRLATKKGVRIVKDDSPEGLKHLHRMLKETAQRNGFGIYRSDDYASSSWRTLREAGKAHLFFATHEGERLAAIFITTLGRKYWYTTGASVNHKRNLMPTYALQWEVMRWAKEHGFTHYDMVGVPKPENLENENDPWYGVYKFKVGFGGEIEDYIGCFDLPVKRARAELWNRIEPVHYRLLMKIKHDIFY